MKEFKSVECPQCATTFVVRFPPKFEVAAKHECATHYWEGFDACLEMVMNSLNEHDDKSLFTVHKFITEFKDHLEYEAELYKTDG